MSDKIVLYNPKAVFYDMPLALLSIASAFDSAEYDVTIIDGRVEDFPEEKLLEAAGDALCLGVTVLTGQPLYDALKMTRAVRKKYPQLPIVWGGWHPSLFPKKTLEDEPAIDITIQGQGEVTFREIVNVFKKQGNIEDVKGVCYRDNGGIIQNPSRPLEDMNHLSPVKYDLIDPEKYFVLKGRRQLDYISSTGCFFRCAFCADPFVFKRKWTAISPEQMGDEIEYYHKKYHFEDVNFQDETFFTYRLRALAVAEQFLKRDLNITWAATMRADQGSRMTEEDFELLSRSGLRRVLIGVESGSQEMLDWLKKDITIEQVYLCAERCKKYGISVHFPFIVGFPEESEESIRSTMDMAKKLRSMSANFFTPIFYFKPYPGSFISQIVVDNGYQLPQTIDEWGKFDYIGSSGPWVSKKKFRLIERFKFYTQFAWSEKKWYYRPLQQLALWRCKVDFYGLPLEKAIKDRFWSRPELS